MNSQKEQNQEIQEKILALSSCKEFNINPENSEYFTLLSPSGFDKIKRQYIYIKSTQKILEIQQSKSDQPKSIFLGNYVQTGQNYLMISEIDPLFLILPYLLEARGKSQGENTGKKQEFTELFKSRGEQYNSIQEQTYIQKYLQNNENIKKNIQKICSYVKYGDDEYYRLENNQLWVWLDNKLQKVQKFFQQHIDVFINNSIQLKQTENVKDDAFYFAMTLMYQYLPFNLFIQYLEKHGLSEKQFMDFRNQQNKKQAQNQNQKLPGEQEENQGFQTQQKTKKQVKSQSANEKKNAEAAVGTKNIMNFFKKVTK